MRSKKTPIFYFCETWKQNFWFFIGWRAKDAEAFLLKRLGVTVQLGDAAGKTLEFVRENVRILIVWTINKNPSLVSHEALHATNKCLFGVGCQASLENDEAQAYLLEDLMRNALK